MSDQIEKVTLESLCGLRMLDGRGSCVLGPDREAYRYENAAVVVFRLDGECYWFQEDPDDGYRSSLDHVKRCTPDDLPPGSFVAFEPRMVSVRIRTKPASYGDRDEVLYGVDERTGLVLFEVGTENLDDYYPNFMHTWTPEGVAAPWLAGVDAA